MKAGQTYKADVTPIINKDDSLPVGVFEAVIATDDLDRQGEHVSIKGMDIPDRAAAYKVYYNHQSYGQNLPIGTWQKLWKVGNKLMGRAKLFVDEYPFANLVAKLVKAGGLDTMSVSFTPKIWDEETETWTESTFVEGSVVSEPANLQAVITAKSLDFTMKDFEDAATGLADSLIDKKAADWVAIPITHTSVDANSAWSANENVKRIPDDGGSSLLKGMYACFDKNANPHLKSSYKFPHHMVSPDGKIGAASLRACTTGISILNGAMNSAKIGKARQGVYDHLAAHIKDANETPPKLKSLDEISEDAADTTNIKSAIEQLKSRLGAVESAIEASAGNPAIKQLIKVRLAAKQVDQASNELNKTIKVKLKEKSNAE